ncbi:MAG: class I SAM-dependent methyltransferase [Arachnia sp.]
MSRHRSIYRIVFVGAVVCLLVGGATAASGFVGWGLLAFSLGLVGLGGASHLRHIVALSGDRRLAATVQAHTQTLSAISAELRSQSASVAALGQAIHAADQRTDSSAASVTAHLLDIASAVRRAEKAALDAATAVGDEKVNGVDDARKAATEHARALRTLMEQLPSALDEYALMRSRLAEDAATLPQLGGWAMTSGVVAAVTREVLAVQGPATIVELGSGGSSTWIGFALRARSDRGHAWSLDHHPVFAEKTRSNLASNGLDSFVTVLDAPLVPITLQQDEHEWYDHSVLPQDLPPINVLLVDGPPGRGRKQVRYPALPVFLSRLAPHAAIILDDTSRQVERETVQRWVEENPGLSIEADLGRATLLRWTPEPAGQPRRAPLRDQGTS